MNTDAIEVIALELLRRYVPAEVPLTLDSDLVADVELDSVALLEVISELEDRFGRRLDDEDLQNAVTVRDLVMLFAEGPAGKHRDR